MTNSKTGGLKLTFKRIYYAIEIQMLVKGFLIISTPRDLNGDKNYGTVQGFFRRLSDGTERMNPEGNILVSHTFGLNNVEILPDHYRQGVD